MSKNKTFDLDGLSDKNDVEAARELIGEITSLIDDLPERAEDFASSVALVNSMMNLRKARPELQEEEALS